MMSGRGAAIKAPSDFLLKLRAHWGRRREGKKVEGESKMMGRKAEKERGERRGNCNVKEWEIRTAWDKAGRK